LIYLHFQGSFGLTFSAKSIYHQLQTVKAKSMLFSDSAIRLIFKHSRGRPRVVNNMATGCLMDVWGLEQHVVDEESVLRVLKEYGFI
jgi:type II secretory pathway predicted ATPase ExeA